MEYYDYANIKILFDFSESYESNIAFLYVSDDMKWGTKNLEDGDDYDLYFVGDGDTGNVESVGYDLAILARCNHTIITRGMMSRWGATLAGGEFYTEYGPIVPHEVYDEIRVQEPEEDEEDLMERIRGIPGMEDFKPHHFSDADYYGEVQAFWWDDIWSWIKYDLYYWAYSFLPF